MQKENYGADILTICVSYNDLDEAVQFVGELLRQRNGYEQKIILVDNSLERKGGETPVRRLKLDSRVLFYCPGENLGYFGGAARALERYLDQSPMPEWIIVSNPDIRIPDSVFLERLLRYYSSDPPAVIAPDIRLAARSLFPSSSLHQNPAMLRRPSSMRMHFISRIFSFYPVYLCYEFLSGLSHLLLNILLPPGNQRVNEKQKQPLEIYAPFGAFIIFNRRYFERGGSLGHKCFLFGEEIFIGEQLRALGLKALYERRLQVTHRQHGSLINLSSRLRAGYVKEVSRYLADTYFS